MNLNELKLAAKRLRKQGAELFGTGAAQLSHAQALDIAARLHGFRDYHEAQQRLGQRHLLEELLAEPGGLLATQGIAFNLSGMMLATHGALDIEGSTGSGKSMLCNELVVQALAQGRPVRIVDCGGSYRRLTQLLQGRYFQGAPQADAYESWSSAAQLVTLDAWTSEDAPFINFERLREVPENALVLCDECWLFRARSQLLQGQTVVRVGQARGDFAAEAPHRLVFSQKTGQELRWQWRVDGQHIELKLHVGPRRMAMYTTRLEHVLAMGKTPTPERLDAFVAALKPQFDCSPVPR